MVSQDQLTPCLLRRYFADIVCMLYLLSPSLQHELIERHNPSSGSVAFSTASMGDSRATADTLSLALTFLVLGA